MPRNEFATMTAGKWLARTALSMALTAAARRFADVRERQHRCETRPAVGGGVITSCHEVGSGAPAQQYRTRQGVGGTTVTSGAGRTCAKRPATGGGMVTTCR